MLTRLRNFTVTKKMAMHYGIIKVVLQDLVFDMKTANSHEEIKWKISYCTLKIVSAG